MDDTTTRTLVWAETAAPQTPDLPAELAGVVDTSSPDPLTWSLPVAASPAQTAAFSTWRSTACRSHLVGVRDDVDTLLAWLRRAGHDYPSPGAVWTLDQAAVTALAWYADEVVPASSVLRMLVGELEQVAEDARRTHRSVRLVTRVGAWPVHSPTR